MGWHFKDLLDSQGRNIVRAWLDTLPLAAQVKIDPRLRHLSVETRLKPPFVKKIVGFDDVFRVVVTSFQRAVPPAGWIRSASRRFHLSDGSD